VRRIALAIVVTLGLSAWVAGQADVAVPVWYRGSPIGVPRLNDLALIRASGVEAIVWPTTAAMGRDDVERLAQQVDLRVIYGTPSSALTAAAATSPDAVVDLVLDGSGSSIGSALAWRSIAHGARIIRIDRSDPARGRAWDGSGPWLRQAAALGRHLTANAVLISGLRLATPVPLAEGDARSLEVVLLDAGRAWVVMATNIAPATRRGRVGLPRGVPYALWVSLLDGSTMAMRDAPNGPVWSFEIGAGGAFVYVIDKEMK
jgi:hypothetical protein